MMTGFFMVEALAGVTGLGGGEGSLEDRRCDIDDSLEETKGASRPVPAREKQTTWQRA
jgi:hypothetical protein